MCRVCMFAAVPTHRHPHRRAHTRRTHPTLTPPFILPAREQSYCPFCTKAKNALRQFLKEFTVIEIEGRPDCDDIQNALAELVGVATLLAGRPSAAAGLACGLAGRAMDSCPMCAWKEHCQGALPLLVQGNASTSSCEWYRVNTAPAPGAPCTPASSSHTLMRCMVPPPLSPSI